MSNDHPTRGGPSARTSTFLFTDIEGSTRLWEEQRSAMADALEVHDALLRAAVEGAGGTVVKTTGDGVLASFDRPEWSLTAAIHAQLALEAQQWPTSRPVRARMAIHSGSADIRDDDFFGPALNRAARLLATGHGGQVLVSGSTAALIANDVPAGSELIDLGEHRLRDLEQPEHVWQLAAVGMRREFPPLRSAAGHASNLPVQTTSFVGRERELADIARLLASSRLVTLVGVGGAGKTRLALQAAADRLEHQRDGAWLVELASLADAGLVDVEIGRALRLQAVPGPPPLDTLVDYLRSKQLLLVLDNCEHLIGTVAEVVARLLATCPALTVLATSREPLGVEGEALVAVPSLSLPDRLDEHDGHWVVEDDTLERARLSEAVALFVERARAILPTFALDRANVIPVVEICRRLDGIPLALELAAARVNVLSVEEIAEGLGDRFRLLTGGRRTAVARQRTLQALIDWSWDLLDGEDRRMLRQLSVFTGGWTLESATAVTHEVSEASPVAPAGRSDGADRLAILDGLGRLVDRSLVAVDHATATRYRMLETIHQYAGDQLALSGETVLLRDRHLGAFRRLALDAGQGLEGPELPAWLARLDAEIENMRAAIDWAGETDPEAGLEMCVAMTRFWLSRTMGSEGRDRMLAMVGRVRDLPEPAVSSVGQARSSLVARALSATVWITAMGGRGYVAPVAEQAILIARQSGDPSAIADALNALLVGANPMLAAGPPADWRSMADEALTIAADLEDWGRLGRIQSLSAMIEAPLDPMAADRWLEQASESAHRTGNPQDLASLSQTRGRVASRTGRLVDAQRWFRQARDQFHAIGDRRFELSAQSEYAHVLRRAGQFDAAEAEYRQTIHGWQQSGARGAIAHQLESFAFLALERGKYERAARLLGAAERLRETAGTPMAGLEREEYDAGVLRLRGEVGAAEFSNPYDAGRELTVDEAVALALAG